MFIKGNMFQLKENVFQLEKEIIYIFILFYYLLIKINDRKSKTEKKQNKKKVKCFGF